MPTFGRTEKVGDLSANDNQLSGDIKELEEYERQSKLADAQRLHLKRLQMTELANSKINHLKVINNWRQFMRSSKLESLKRDLETLAQDHEREVDRKDALVNMLIRSLDEAEEQSQTAQRAHFRQVDRLSSLHEQRLAALEIEFESELRTTRSEFDAELRSIQASHVRERKELLSIIESVEQAERERDNEARQEHDTEREDIRTKNIDDINMLRLTLESVIDDLEKQFDEAHAQYMENTEKKTKDFKALTEEDKKFSDEIDRQLRQIERLQTLLTYWRKKIGQSEREGRERNRQLKAEKEMVMKHYHELKDRMNASRNGQSRRLTELALWAREAFETNTERIHRAERILTLAEQARKLESTSERVLPFVPSALDEQLVDAELSANSAALGDELRAQLDADSQLNANEWTELDRFFRTYNRALLSKLTIEQELQRLSQENKDLRSILKQYLDGITVTPEAVDGPNPLLVVNGRVNLNQRPVRNAGRRDPVVVEGNTVVMAYAAQGR